MTVHINENGKRSTFIHIPKNAGTTISQWLWTNKSRYATIWNASVKAAASPEEKDIQNKFGGKHAEENQIKSHFGDLGFTFICIRNPWDRLLSAYHYYFPRRKKSNNPKCFESFEKFVLGRDWHCATKQQIEYYHEENIDHIISYENLNEDFKTVQTYYGSSIPLGNYNSSRNRKIKRYQNNYTNEMADLVYELHKDDIKRFGYSFE